MNSADNNGGFYGRTPGAPDVRRTYIAGIRHRAEQTTEKEEETLADRADRIELQTRPLAGLLYSVSRDFTGEIFPVYVGRNTIGSEPACDIYLSEDTVSPNHAVLLVRMLPDGMGNRVMSASITDYDSEFGSAVNGQRLGYDKMNLNGHEIIVIGNSYQFLFIPLDAAKHGLEPVQGFVSVPRKKPAPEVIVQQVQPTGFYAPASVEEVYPSSVGEEDEQTFYGRSYAKKEDHSSKKTIL